MLCNNHNSTTVIGSAVNQIFYIKSLNRTMLLVLLIITGLLGLLYVVLWWHKATYKCDRCLKRFPGPKGIPIIGNALEIGNLETILPTLMEFQKVYGHIYGLKVGPTRFVVLTDQKILEFLLKSKTLVSKGCVYRFFEKWIGCGLVSLPVEKWQIHRKILNPALSFEWLKKMLIYFDSATDILIQKLEETVDEESVEIMSYVGPCTLDIIFESTMGISINAQSTANSYLKYVDKMIRISTERIFSPIKMFDFLYQFTKDYQFEQEAAKVLINYGINAIKSRTEVNSEEAQKEKRFAFLDILLSATVDGKPLSDDDIRAEINTFILGGYETTATVISFVMHCLAKYPKKQNAIVKELQEIFRDDSNRTANYQDLQKMKYLECFIKETMRLYPPLPLVLRQLEEDVEYDGEILPKNLALLIFIFGIHRNPKYFPDPEKFNPERFTTENSNLRSPYCYIPFSAGPRNCIGQRFAMLEMKSILSKVLRYFEILPVIPEHNLKLVAVGALKASNKILIRLKKRFC